MAHAPDGHALVELDALLGKVVEILMLAAFGVHLDERQSRAPVRSLKLLAEQLGDAAQLLESRRVEAAAVAEHLADLGVLPRRHVLEHVERERDELEAVVRAA